jgi:hypothetical protein
LKISEPIKDKTNILVVAFATIVNKQGHNNDTLHEMQLENSRAETARF